IPLPDSTMSRKELTIGMTEKDHKRIKEEIKNELKQVKAENRQREKEMRERMKEEEALQKQRQKEAKKLTKLEEKADKSDSSSSITRRKDGLYSSSSLTQTQQVLFGVHF